MPMAALAGDSTKTTTRELAHDLHHVVEDRILEWSPAYRKIISDYRHRLANAYENGLMLTPEAKREHLKYVQRLRTGGAYEAGFPPPLALQTAWKCEQCGDEIGQGSQLCRVCHGKRLYGKKVAKRAYASSGRRKKKVKGKKSLRGLSSGLGLGLGDTRHPRLSAAAFVGLGAAVGLVIGRSRAPAGAPASAILPAVAIGAAAGGALWLTMR